MEGEHVRTRGGEVRDFGSRNFHENTLSIKNIKCCGVAEQLTQFGGYLLNWRCSNLIKDFWLSFNSYSKLNEW
ncbi:hypothetical protein [Thermococcus sibiricus]|uniref:Uncharacterized protein n=1 Tax=Thermococcus sibiricus (strain DSM 12597 / MM 739) TaxID=604354 RepID=C6A076_THESM|nr:hypothetical protein [Thermococcus sibiricus]ACS91057.1 hypothetical protein TSIB_2010 [Thermococcus sibiricus MM 739]